MPALRPLTAADVPACADIVARTPLFAPYGYGQAQAEADLERELARDRPESTMLVAAAEKTGAVLGFCRFVLRGAFDRCGYLRLIAVDPARTARGTGRLLLGELERRHLAPHGIMLLCASDNPGAQQFYRRLGYEKVGEIPSYVGPGLDEHIYYKRPPSPPSPT